MVARAGCPACRDGVGFTTAITMASQPIADLRRGSVLAHEATLPGTDGAHLPSILTTCREHGFMTAADDLGARYAGLNPLAWCRPDVVMPDMALVRDVDHRPERRAIVRHGADTLAELGSRVVADRGSRRRRKAPLDLGIDLIRGSVLARPAVETLAPAAWPYRRRSRRPGGAPARRCGPAPATPGRAGGRLRFRLTRTVLRSRGAVRGPPFR